MARKTKMTTHTRLTISLMLPFKEGTPDTPQMDIAGDVLVVALKALGQAGAYAVTADHVPVEVEV